MIITKYYIPPENVKLGMIANTPHWLREHFISEGRESQRQEILNWADSCFYKDSSFTKSLKQFLSKSSEDKVSDLATPTSPKRDEKAPLLTHSNSDHDTLCGKKGIHTCKYPSFRPRGKK